MLIVVVPAVVSAPVPLIVLVPVTSIAPLTVTLPVPPIVPPLIAKLGKVKSVLKFKVPPVSANQPETAEEPS